jgi:hypothetical protein
MPQRLAQHLIARSLLPAAAVDGALRRVQQEGGTLDTALLENGAISEAGILQALSDVSGIRLVNLADFEPNAEAGPLMPFKMARQLSCVPLSLDGKALHVACAFPLPASQLKEAGFFLGRTFELWVAVECRIRDWQRALYGQPLEPRYLQLLRQLDPNKPLPQRETERTQTVSEEVLERMSQGIRDEPILLDRPKPKRPTQSQPVLEVVPIGDDEPRTAVLDATAYGHFAKNSTTLGVELSSLGEADSTRVLDVSGYAAFAKQVTPAVSGPLTFPGGVLPPRPVARAPDTKRIPTPPPQISPMRPAPPATKPSTPDESDFSDLDVVTDSRPALPPVPEAPQELVSRGDRPQPLTIRDSPAPLLKLREAPTRRNSENVRRTDPAATLVGEEEPVIEATPTAPRPDEPPPLRLPPLPSKPPPQLQPSLESEPPLEPVPLFSSPSGVRQTVLAAANRAKTLEHEARPVPLASQDAPTNPREWTLANARAALAQAVFDRDQLISVVLGFAQRCFEYTCAFAVMRGAAFGWDVRGDADAAALREIAIPLDAASIFRTVALTRGSYVGPLPPDALSKHYLAQLGRMPRTVFVWPVEVQTRLVAILYGDCGAGPVSQRRLADFILFCQDLPGAFHQLILNRRTHPQAPGLPEPEPYLPPIPTTESPAPLDAPTDADWYQGLVSLLTGPQPSERSMAMLELMKTPHLSAGALATAFPGPTGWSRLPVVDLPEPDELGPIPGAMARLGEPGALALAPLLDSEDSDTRYLALLTAGSLRSPSLVDGIVRGLFDLEPDISSAARAAAAALRGVAAFQAKLPALRQALLGHDSLRKSLTARALGILHDRPSVEPLISMTGNDDPLCATAAAEALQEITRQGWGPDTAGWVEWWSTNKDLRRFDWLIEALLSLDFDLRLSAIEELTRAFGETWGYFADGPPEERQQAAQAWRSFADAHPELDV